MMQSIPQSLLETQTGLQELVRAVEWPWGKYLQPGQSNCMDVPKIVQCCSDSRDSFNFS